MASEVKNSDLFSRFPVKNVELHTGKQIGIPVQYKDSRAMIGHFPAPARLVRQLLPTKNLTPVSFLPGTAILSVAAMEYHDISDVQPYNEVSIMVPVQYRPTINLPGIPLLFHNHFKTFGFYVIHLPVTTTEAMEFGIELWGYPKFIADIEFQETPTQRTCNLSVAGSEVLELTVDRRPVKRCRKQYSTYTIKDGRLVRTKICTDENSVTKRMSKGASLKLGGHEIGNRLRETQVKSSAVEFSYAPQADSVLFLHEQEFEI